MAWKGQGGDVPIRLKVGAAGACVTASGVMASAAASAHATGQGFVALLPTGPYMAVGVATVALSIMLLWFLPHRSASALLPSRGIGRIAAPAQLRTISSLAVFLLLCGGVASGLTGARDPLENPLVLGFWVAFWMASPMVQGYLFDLWGWISPWTMARAAVVGVVRPVGRRWPVPLSQRLGSRLRRW